jgi:hypothetical protein
MDLEQIKAEVRKEPKLLMGSVLVLATLILSAYSCNAHYAYRQAEEATVKAVPRRGARPTEVAVQSGPLRKVADKKWWERTFWFLFTLAGAVAAALVFASIRRPIKELGEAKEKPGKGEQKPGPPGAPPRP